MWMMEGGAYYLAFNIHSQLKRIFEEGAFLLDQLDKSNFWTLYYDEHELWVLTLALNISGIWTKKKK